MSRWPFHDSIDVPDDDGPSTEDLKSMSRKERKKLEKERAFKKQLEGMETAEAAEGIGGQFTVGSLCMVSNLFDMSKIKDIRGCAWISEFMVQNACLFVFNSMFVATKQKLAGLTKSVTRKRTKGLLDVPPTDG